MKDVIIARELIKIARELCAGSIPLNRKKSDIDMDQLEQQALKQGWEVLLEKLRKYAANIQKHMNDFASKRESQWKLINQQIQIIKEAKKTNPSIEVDKTLLKKLQLLSPEFAKIDSDKEILRKKAESLMLAGSIEQVFHVFARLLARETQIINMTNDYVQHINKIINDSGFKIYVRRGKQASKQQQLKNFIKAAQDGKRMKQKSNGATLELRNLVITMTDLSGNVLAYDSVSNAYMQYLEGIEDNDVIQKATKLLEQGNIYDPDNKQFKDPYTGEVVLDISKYKMPQTVPNLRVAGFIDWIKDVGNKVVSKFNDLYNKAKSFIKSLFKVKNVTEDLQKEYEQFIEQIKIQKKMFDELIAELTKE